MATPVEMTADRWITLAFAPLFGGAVGSFLNVCIFRLPRHCLSVLRPAHSMCLRCLEPVHWYDNVPVVSWFVLRGRCRHCDAPFSIRYPAVEALTALLFLLAAWHFIVVPGDRLWLRLGAGVVASAFLSALVVSTFIDLDWRIIPDEITLGGTVVGLAGALVAPDIWVRLAPHLNRSLGEHLSAAADNLGWSVDSGLLAILWPWLPWVLGAATGAGVLYVTRVFGTLLFRKEAMGLGDVKFMAFVGAFLGPGGVLMTFFLACLVGSLIGGIGRLLGGDRYTPFGPYLAAGAILTLFLEGPILWLVVEWWPAVLAGVPPEPMW